MSANGDWLYSLDEIVAHLPAEPRDDRFYYPLRHGSLKAGIYAPQGSDGQSWHDQDELYIVTSGEGAFARAGEVRRFKPGDLIFVPANVDHRFFDFSSDFACRVIFWGPRGGEAGVAAMHSGTTPEPRPLA